MYCNILSNLTFCSIFLIISRKMFTIFLLLTFLFSVFNTQQPSRMNQQCIQYQSGRCIRCHNGQHIHTNLCFNNIKECVSYQYINGVVSCLQCSNGYMKNGNGKCLQMENNEQSVNSRILVESERMNLIEQYSNDEVEQAIKSQQFQRVNNFMLFGQYKHFITQSSDKVKSVSVTVINSQRIYRILYNGSGGGLMLCIISINSLEKMPKILSFVSIGIQNVIEKCTQYTLQSKCSKCDKGYHLQNGLCYHNIENCKSYVRNICIECKQFSLLLENRCITNCRLLSDSSQIRFYGDYRAYLKNVLPIISRQYLLQS